MLKHSPSLAKRLVLNLVMKLWIILFLCLITATAFAQEKEVTGIVFDKESKARIAKVKVQNTTTGKSAYNTFKGEFNINAKPGDVLVFTKPDHYADTVTIKNYASLAIYLRPVAIQLNEVTVRDTLLNPQKRLEATKNEFNKVYGSLAYRDVLNVSPGGAGISIDALYNIFSKSGRNAAHLQEIINRDYRQNIIDYRFNKAFVQGITGLKEPELTDFMLKYRPGYFLVTTASDYDFIASIRANLKRFRRNPRAYELAPLPAVKWSAQ